MLDTLMRALLKTYEALEGDVVHGLTLTPTLSLCQGEGAFLSPLPGLGRGLG